MKNIKTNHYTNLKQYWSYRAKNYNKTNWVKDRNFLQSFISLIPENKTLNNALEIGIGTGIVANALLNRVNNIYGIDISREMILKLNSNIGKIIGDANYLPCKTNYFDLIVMRNVLHYLKGNQFIVEVGRCLSQDGLFLFGMVIPFKDEISQEYDYLIGRDIHYPTKTEILQLFKDFNILEVREFILKSQSIKNWLDNTLDDEEKKIEIINRHLNSSDLYKSLVDFKYTDGDIYVDIKHLMILAEK